MKITLIELSSALSCSQFEKIVHSIELPPGGGMTVEQCDGHYLARGTLRRGETNSPAVLEVGGRIPWKAVPVILKTIGELRICDVASVYPATDTAPELLRIETGAAHVEISWIGSTSHAFELQCVLAIFHALSERYPMRLESDPAELAEADLAAEINRLQDAVRRRYEECGWSRGQTGEEWG